MNAAKETKISLREYIDLRFAENQNAISNLQKFIEARMNDTDEALRLQSVEYARRLEELNHSHANAEKDRAKYLLAEKFYTFTDQYTKDTMTVKEFVAAEKARQIANTIVSSGIISVLVGVAIAVISRSFE